MLRTGGWLSIGIVKVVISLLILVDVLNAADPVLSPETVTDTFGNSADKNSNVTWAPLPQGQQYTTDTTYHHAGLQGFYNLCKGFLGIVQPNEFPVGEYIITALYHLIHLKPFLVDTLIH